MTDIASVALSFFAAAAFAHALSASLAVWRCRKARPNAAVACVGEPVTIVRPVCGLDHFDELTLRSTFELDDADARLIFCCARNADPAAALLRKLIADHPSRGARLLIGDERPTANPKLNNVVKGWKAATTEWVILADSNVLMPRDYVARMLSAYTDGCGLVCSPPLASRPDGFWAEVECAFLNTHQARWQYAADAIGLGFAQGKSMLWRKSLLDDAGGILALGAEIAEDAAATKIVRDRGLKVCLAAPPFEQPLGPRSARQVWDRQVRWARLRRATFPLYYAPEVLTGAFAPLVALGAGAAATEANPFAIIAGAAAGWYAIEAALAWRAGWTVTWLSPAAWVLRDMMLPALWIEGFAADSFTWRGNDMTVATDAQ